MTSITLGTAKIVKQGRTILLTYMDHGSFLIGEREYGNHNAGLDAAIRFCDVHDLRIIEPA